MDVVAGPEAFLSQPKNNPSARAIAKNFAFIIMISDCSVSRCFALANVFTSSMLSIGSGTLFRYVRQRDEI